MAPHLLRCTPARLAVLGLAVTLAGCSSLDGVVNGEKIDYRSQAGNTKTQPLDVPPDLSQLAREGRYQTQTGVVVSASAMKTAAAPAAGGTAPAATAAAPSVAPNAVGDSLRIVRDGQQRWLVTQMPPETLYPLVRSFWLERGFVLTQDSPELGLLETDWAENRAKLPNDFIRNTLGKVFDNLFSTGERDKFRVRIERTATGSELYLSHRGLQEVAQGQLKEAIVWQPRPADPQLEAEFLSRLMLRLGAKDDASARAAVATAAPGLRGDAPAPTATAAAAKPAEGTGRARLNTSAGTAALDLDEAFDGAWRQVGLALDRSGFTVEDRDRRAGLYFVRYADPKLAGQEEPGFFAKLFGKDGDAAKRLQRYRIAVKADGGKTLVSVQNSDGGADNGDTARTIIGRLVEALR